MARAIPILPIEDPAEAKRFYVDALGFALLFEAAYAEDPAEGTILGVERDGMEIHLDCPMPGHGRDACVYLEVDDADTMYSAWRNKVEIPQPPENQPWGRRTFGVMDPFGNTLFVVGPLPGDQEGGMSRVPWFASFAIGERRNHARRILQRRTGASAMHAMGPYGPHRKSWDVDWDVHFLTFSTF